jgi:hypothetical protein
MKLDGVKQAAQQVSELLFSLVLWGLPQEQGLGSQDLHLQ